MSKLIFILSALVLFSGCGEPQYTAEEIVIIEKEKRKTAIVREEISKRKDERKKTDDKFFCEDICWNNWNGGDPICTINCINALKDGDLLNKSHAPNL